MSDLLGDWIDRQPSGRPLLASALRGAVRAALDAGLADALPDAAFTDPRLFAWVGGIRPDGVAPAQLLRRHAGTTAPCAPPGAGALAAIRRKVPRTEIEWIEAADPVLCGFLARHVAHGTELELEFGDEPYREPLDAAMTLLHAHAPAWHRRLGDAVKSLLVFRHRQAASFAALGVHGLVGVNAARGSTLCAFIDALAHQGGHVLLTEATLDQQRWFEVAATTQVGAASGDARTLYETLHGLFTMGAVIEVFGAIDPQDLASPTDRMERRGRIALARTRLALDLAALRRHASGHFKGPARDMVAVLENMLGHHDPDRRDFDLGGQREDFDVGVFLSRNLIPTT